MSEVELDVVRDREFMLLLEAMRRGAFRQKRIVLELVAGAEPGRPVGRARFSRYHLCFVSFFVFANIGWGWG